MLHTGRHEQPHELGAALHAHFCADIFEITNRVQRRYRRICPAMEQYELAAPRRELAQVRIGGIHQGAELLDDARGVAIKIKLLDFPVCILLHHRADESPSESRLRTLAWFHAQDPAAPVADF